ncbi:MULTISPECIES: AMP-binding protein [Sphingomonas]|uniref:AMP-binding protein n=1 Tax=Sphingomonas TaxID=13687 RepID=UPI000DEFCA79|nr:MULTISPECIES: AMP-binding protein [Sphingomonas]
MQSYALTVDKLLDHAAKWFGDREVVTGGGSGPDDRIGYAALRRRANLLSGALASLGVTLGTRVATLAWNSRHHVELTYAAMGIGSVCHTLNPRLTIEQLAAMIDEAGDILLAVAGDLIEQGAELKARCSSVRHLILLDDEGATSPAGTLTIDKLIEDHGVAVPWGDFDERTVAGLCFTSGTTGAPKGVEYTHRSNYLHTLRALAADAVALTARESLLLAVPMFHANGWGLPFAAPAAGTKLVLPGRHLDGASLAGLIRAEQVTVAVGVPTVWLGLLEQLERSGESVPSLERILIGGSSCPAALIERLERGLGARVQTSWGMTELSPIGTLSPPFARAVPGTAGRPPLGLDLKLTDADGTPLTDQRAGQGHLWVRGPSVLDRYLGAENDALDAEGYFPTGDLATIDRDGNLTICGRAKDLIKSGGEWINPAEIEAIVGADTSVQHVAVIARPHVRWGERPVMIVERAEGAEPVDLLALLKGRIAGWWLPDAVIEISAMPLAATGKIDKQRLRREYASDPAAAA